MRTEIPPHVALLAFAGHAISLPRFLLVRPLTEVLDITRRGRMVSVVVDAEENPLE